MVFSTRHNQLMNFGIDHFAFADRLRPLRSCIPSRTSFSFLSLAGKSCSHPSSGTPLTLCSAILVSGAAPPHSRRCPASTPYTSKSVVTKEFFGPGGTSQEVVTQTVTGVRARSCPTTTTSVTTQAPGVTCSFNTSDCIRIQCIVLSTTTASCPTRAADPCCTNTATQTKYAVSSALEY